VRSVNADACGAVTLASHPRGLRLCRLPSRRFPAKWTPVRGGRFPASSGAAKIAVDQGHDVGIMNHFLKPRSRTAGHPAP
jgi:hypothetical protein